MRSAAARTASRAHPRSRGENSADGDGFPPRGGSSPLTRGKLYGSLTGQLGPGLIPAHAGKTWSFNSDTSVTWAHPRSRGENAYEGGGVGSGGGSSPLTRGKQEGRKKSGPSTRLIPAHAGKTGGIEGQELQQGAHPRSRGENSDFFSTACPAAGSSPLTRGKHG